MHEWKFHRLAKDEVKNDPQEISFFQDEALKTIVDCLVREDIQNRLDAKADTPPQTQSGSPGNKVPVLLKVRVACGRDALRPDAAAKWFEHFPEHCNSKKVLEHLNKSSPLSLSTDPVPYVLLECFNTTGLRGDPLQTRDPDEPENPRNDFFWFVRNMSRTGKRRGTRGKWGIGKIVYPASSDIHSYFVLSRRAESPSTVLIGRATLVIHKAADDNEYSGQGFWGRFDDAEQSSFAAPLTDETDAETISSFRNDFGIRRTNEIGTSIVIPYAKKEITAKSFAFSSVRFYYWEILNGNLEIVISGDDGSEYRINATTLTSEFIRQTFSEDDELLNRLCDQIDFARTIVFRPETVCSFRMLRRPNNLSAYYDDLPELFGADQWKSLEEKFKQEELVAIRVPVSFTLSGNSEVIEDHYRLFMQKLSEGDPDGIFVRDGLTIVGEKLSGRTLVRAMSCIERHVIDGGNSPCLSDFCGDAEPPAHTAWIQTNPNFQKYGQKNLLQFIRSFPSILTRRLSDNLKEKNQYALVDFFGVDDDSGNEKPKQANRKRGRKSPTQPNKQYVRKPVGYRIDSYKGGFVVAATDGFVRTPTSIYVKVAYAAEGIADPFAAYDLADFDCRKEGTIKLTLTHARIGSREINSFVFIPERPEFKIVVSGFDDKRDLSTQSSATYPSESISEGESEKEDDNQ